MTRRGSAIRSLLSSHLHSKPENIAAHQPSKRCSKFFFHLLSTTENYQAFCPRCGRSTPSERIEHRQLVQQTRRAAR